MEWKQRTYHSRCVVGQIFDKVKKVEFDPIYDQAFDKRILRWDKGVTPELLKLMRKMKSKYDTAMRRLMGQKEIATEFEVWTGFILSRPRVGSDYKQSEEVGAESLSLRTRFREATIKSFHENTVKDPDSCRDMESLAPVAAAAYRVTLEEVRIALHECSQVNISSDGQLYRRRVNRRSMPLISFPWLFHRELGFIATSAKSEVVQISSSSTSEQLSLPEPHANNRDGNTSGGGCGNLVPFRGLDLEELIGMDYVRDANGRITHRGEPLTLFGHRELDDEDEDFVLVEGEEAMLREDLTTYSITFKSPQPQSEEFKKESTSTKFRDDDLIAIEDASSTGQGSGLGARLTPRQSEDKGDGKEEEDAAEQEVVVIKKKDNVLLRAAKLLDDE